MSVEVSGWYVGFDDLFARVTGWFGRVEPRQQARDYVRGLLGPVERRNRWQIAEYAAHGAPYRLQRLLGLAAWDPELVRDDGVLIVVDDGCVKKGVTSAWVAWQYTGTSGKIELCQIGVFALTPRALCGH